jgi:D-alanyl-lipoteichoic acid acyltransferase DltB (MBOAT superfamily)
MLPRIWQNVLLLISSYFFYATWDWRYLSIIIFLTLVNYYLGNKIFSSTIQKEKKIYAIIGIFIDISILGFFKYFNFFLDSLDSLLTIIGLSVSILHLDIILPIGISFYTFQKIAYLYDLYKEKTEPADCLLTFALFSCFFPQLVAGPIEKPSHLLPQFQNERKWELNKIIEGVDLIFWGLLKKVFIADNIAYYVNMIFSLKEPSTLLILVATFAFGIQIYTDFSGYSDIAKGSARLLGIDLVSNFNHPYLSKNPQEFWRRWHISLSLWLRDYLYIPLGGSRCSRGRHIFNLFVTWFICGLWHGAAWHFVIWGLYNGLMVSLSRFWKSGNGNKNLSITLIGILSVGVTYFLMNLGWLFFRVENIADIWDYFSYGAIFRSTADITVSVVIILILIFYSLPLIIADVILYLKKINLNIIVNKNLNTEKFRFLLPYRRGLCYFIIFFVIVIFGGNETNEFIYFQF